MMKPMNVLGVFFAVPLTVMAQQIPDAVLKRITDSVCYAEPFETEAFAPLGEGISGKGMGGNPYLKTPMALKLDGDASFFPVASGSFSFWVRGKTWPKQLVCINDGGLFYINAERIWAAPIGVHLGWKNESSLTCMDDGLPPIGDEWHLITYTWHLRRSECWIDDNRFARGYGGGSFSAGAALKNMGVGTFWPAKAEGGADAETPQWVFDEFRLYNRPLTREEVSALYTAGKANDSRAWRVPETLAKPVAGLPVVAWARPDTLSVAVQTDFAGYNLTTNYTDQVVVTLTDARKNKVVAKRNFMPEDADFTRLVELEVPLKSPLPDGTYRVDVNHAGGVSGTAQFERVRREWEGNTIGISKKVPPPWTPMSVKGDKISCWGRTYTLGTLGLPQQIRSLQPEPVALPDAEVDLLAAAIRLVAETPDGKELAFKGGAPKIAKAEDGVVHVLATARSADGKLDAQLKGTLAYDGFYRFKVSVSPRWALALNAVRLEIPLPNAFATLFHAGAEDMRAMKWFSDFSEDYLTSSHTDNNGQQNGSRVREARGENGNEATLWDSSWDCPTGKRNAALGLGTFWPSVWLGNDDRGIAFMADNVKGWKLDDAKGCMDVVRQGGVTTFRLLLMNAPAMLDRPLEAEVSLQATPVRPRPKGGSWHKSKDYGWYFFDMNLVWKDVFTPFREGRGEVYHDHHTYGRKTKADVGDRWWRYACLQSNRVGPEDPEWGMHYAPYVNEWGNRTLVGYDPAALLSRSCSDFAMWCWKQWHDTAGMTGLYFDNTYPQLVEHNISHLDGIVWRDEKGERRSGFRMFAAREYMKRVYTYFREQRPGEPVLNGHITDSVAAGYLGFFDFWLDGENDGWVREGREKKSGDFIDRWAMPQGLLNLRVTLGRQWGAMPRYLFEWDAAPTYAVLSQFDLDKCHIRTDRLNYDFGTDAEDCRFAPHWGYWRPVKMERVKLAPVLDSLGWGLQKKEHEDARVAVWSRPGRARVVVSNFGEADIEGVLYVDAKELGLPENFVVTDERSGEDVCAMISVPRHNYRVLLFAAPGVFPAAGGRASAPEGGRVERLCDDFAVSNKLPWVMASGPGITKAPPDKLYPWHQFWADGTLEFYAGKGDAVQARVPFGVENATAQVTIRSSSGSRCSGFGMTLYWGKDKFVQITGGSLHNWPPDYTKQVAHVRAAGNLKPLERKTDVRLGANTSVRIVLKPGEIEFLASADGAGWVTAGTLPREGLEGAPEWLILGQGSADGNAGFLLNEPLEDHRSGHGWAAWAWYRDLVVTE